MAEEITSIYQGPVLVLKVAKPGSFWTPFFAASQFAVEAGYLSNGENKVGDRSWEIISRPGYQQVLADYLAGQIVSTLKDPYRVSISGVPI